MSERAKQVDEWRVRLSAARTALDFARFKLMMYETWDGAREEIISGIGLARAVLNELNTEIKKREDEGRN